MRLFLTLLFFSKCFFSNGQIISTIAGNGTNTYSGDNGNATAASVGFPGDIIIDNDGNIYVGEYNNTIRRVSTSGVITTVAGNGLAGYNGDNQAATLAEMNGVSGLAIDRLGNLYVADMYNNRIRKINLTGYIETIAGSGVGSFSGDNGPASAASLYSPFSLTFDTIGNLYVADEGNHRIRKISSTGIITTFAGNGTNGFSGDFGPATSASISVYGLCTDRYNNIYFCDNNRIRRIDAVSGVITTVAGDGLSGYYGDGSSATAAEFFFPQQIKINKFDDILVTDVDNNRIRLINSNNIISTIAGTGAGSFNGDNIPAILTNINSPRGIAVDTCSDFFIADNGNHRVRKVSFPQCNYLYAGDLDPKSSITISPNPAVEYLEINNIKANSEFILQNIIGKVVKAGMLRQGANTISLSHLPAGLYVMEIIDNNKQKTVTKIIKQ